MAHRATDRAVLLAAAKRLWHPRGLGHLSAAREVESGRVDARIGSEHRGRPPQLAIMTTGRDPPPRGRRWRAGDLCELRRAREWR